MKVSFPYLVVYVLLCELCLRVTSSTGSDDSAPSFVHSPHELSVGTSACASDSAGSAMNCIYPHSGGEYSAPVASAACKHEEEGEDGAEAGANGEVCTLGAPPPPSPPPSASASAAPRAPPASESGASSTQPAPITALQLWRWRESARELLQHAWGSYMRKAWPADELRPLSCAPRWWHERERGDLDDVLLGGSLTLIDSLDTLAVLGNWPAFRCAVSKLVGGGTGGVWLGRDVQVSVFETSIRVLGGLLSAHMISTDPALGVWADSGEAGSPCPAGNCSAGRACACPALPHLHFCPEDPADPHYTPCLPAYEGQLLSLAVEVAQRLMPAFNTPTGLPYHRINLGTGRPDPASRATCTAAAGTFLLEWGVLSRLTGDGRYEAVARRAVRALWERRARSTGLLGNAVDAVDGSWRTSHAGVGAGVDSYLEYLAKASVALGDDSLWELWEAASAAVRKHLDTPTARLHIEVGMGEGKKAPRPPLVVSPLQAWYPGGEVLAGHVAEGRAHWKSLASLWAEYSALPEGYDVGAGQPMPWGKDSPLRPELVEATYHLFTATQDPALLLHGAAQLQALHSRSRVACGYASLADVTTGRLDDRMDSFFIAETGKYLYSLFDQALLQGWAGVAAGNSSRDSGSGSWSDSAGQQQLPQPGPQSKWARGIAKLYPSANPLAYHRYDMPLSNSTGGTQAYGDTAATLALPQDKVLYTTEGHVLLLHMVPPAVPLRPRGGKAAASPAASPARSPHGGAEMACPRVAPHALVSPPPPNRTLFADFILELSAIEAAALGFLGAHGKKATSPAQGKSAPRVCRESQVSSAVALRDSAFRFTAEVNHSIVATWNGLELPGSTGLDKAVVPKPPCAAIPVGALSVLSAGVTDASVWAYPFIPSDELMPNTLRSFWSGSVRPSLQADLLSHAPEVAKAIFNLHVPTAHTNVVRVSEVRTTWDYSSNDWIVTDWSDQEFFPSEKLARAVRRRKGLHMVVDNIQLSCDPRTAHCSAQTGMPARYAAYRIVTDTAAALAASANFGPSLTSHGLHGLVVWRALLGTTEEQGCSSYTHAIKPDEPFAAVVMRGNCSFAQKTRIAEEAGAKLILILDTMEQNQTVSFDTADGHWTADFVMAGDNQQPSPGIPAAFLPRTNAVQELLASDILCARAALLAVSQETISKQPSHTTTSHEVVEIVSELFSSDEMTNQTKHIFGEAETTCDSERR